MGNSVILVPYRRAHVSKYHAWMQNEELRHLTGSEPLSLDEEYQMQETWHTSKDKCTFIVLDKERMSINNNEEEAMIGDTNLFLSDEDGQAESEIMIAEVSARGRGRGREAMCLMLRYGIEKLSLKAFEAKIKLNNQVSINMFKKIGFQEVSRSEVFQEVTLVLEMSEEKKAQVFQFAKSFNLQPYVHSEL